MRVTYKAVEYTKGVPTLDFYTPTYRICSVSDWGLVSYQSREGYPTMLGVKVHLIYEEWQYQNYSLTFEGAFHLEPTRPK